jgi:hypothetical protein
MGAIYPEIDDARGLLKHRGFVDGQQGTLGHGGIGCPFGKQWTVMRSGVITTKILFDRNA